MAFKVHRDKGKNPEGERCLTKIAYFSPFSLKIHFRETVGKRTHIYTNNQRPCPILLADPPHRLGKRPCPQRPS